MHFGGDGGIRAPDLLRMKELLLPTELHHRNLVEARGIEPRTEACKATAFPITPCPQIVDNLSFSTPSTKASIGPCDTIRTCDHLVPNQELYQAELHTG